MPAPVIMVHGAFCGGWVFERFREPFEAAGHEVLTPDLPGHSPGGAVASQSMSDFADHVAQLCRTASEPPILIGHSMGGLISHLAASRAPVSALILLAPSPPWGVPGASMEEAVSAMSLYALGPFWLQAIAPDYALAKLYSLDRMEKADRKAVFARMVPESGLALWQTLNWWLDPFMTTSVPAGRLAARFEVWRDMSHWLPCEPGGDDVAALCLSWLSERRSAAA